MRYICWVPGTPARGPPEPTQGTPTRSPTPHPPQLTGPKRFGGGGGVSGSEPEWPPWVAVPYSLSVPIIPQQQKQKAMGLGTYSE